MSHILALDQGTSSSRSIVFDAAGRIVASAQREFAQHFPRPGWVEHDPRDLWESQLATAREALAAAGLAARDVTAVGIANQRETTLVWERATGRPIHRAIVWQDRRTEPLCARLRDGKAGELIRARTGLVVDPYFSGTKLRWILDAVPGAMDAARRGELAFGTVDSWLVWNLTGGRVHATDVSNASRTMLWNLREACWDDALLDALGIPRAVLPRVHASAHAFGNTQADLLGAAIPIGGIAGDQQAALFGQACFRPGMAKNTYGTGCFMLMHTGGACEPSRNGLVVTAAAQAPGAPEYAIEGSVFVGGAVVQWMRDGLRTIARSSDIEALAASVPDSGGVTFVPAFTGLGAPYWKPDAQGAILGLSRGTTAAHIARAALESIAFQSAALLGAMGREAADAGAQPISELRVDGGACANDLLMQFQADLLGIPVVRPVVIETTALGAAYLAGLSTGVWSSREALAGQWRAERTFHPTMSRDAAEALMQRWERAVARTAG